VSLVDVRAEAAKLLDACAAICERRKRWDGRLPRMPRNVFKANSGLTSGGSSSAELRLVGWSEPIGLEAGNSRARDMLFEVLRVCGS
jgi:hypothetical protein